MTNSRLHAVATSVSTIAVLVPADALACRWADMPHTLDADEEGADSTHPDAPTFVIEQIVRGGGDPCEGLGSCDDAGRIVIRLTATNDDRTPADSLGYIVEGIGDDAPTISPTEAVRADDGLLFARWDDGAAYEQEPVAFDITVTAVDFGGNMSEPSDPVEVVDPGRGAANADCETSDDEPSGGCAASGGALGSPGPFAIGLVGLALVRRRKGLRPPGLIGSAR